MIERFQGPTNKFARLTALKRQLLVSQDAGVAGLFDKKATLVAFEAGDVLIKQNATDDDIYLLLAGSVTIEVNGHALTVRENGEHVGEMAIVNVGEPRSASVIAREPTVAAKVSRADFEQIADREPNVWRRVAEALTTRLKQRNNLIRMKNETPILFLGSSTESLSIVRSLKRIFEKRDGPFIVRAWVGDNVFKPSNHTMEDLFAQLLSVDFALFVFSPDDKVFSRKKAHEAPRDNILLELGMFMGAIGKDRSFIIEPTARFLDPKNARKRLKKPSDLDCVTTLRYSGENWKPALSDLRAGCGEIAKIIARLGSR